MMKNRVYAKSGDDKQGLLVNLKRNGEPEPLTGCTVEIFISNGIKAHAMITDEVNGQVFFSLEGSMMSIPGIYKAEFKVTFPDGRFLTYPQNDYIYIHVKGSVN